MKQGFSLVEILIVIGIMGALLAATFAGYNAYRRARATSTTQQRLGTVAFELDKYHDQVGSYPKDLQELLEGPANKRSSYVPNLTEKDIKDAWDQELVYEPHPGQQPPYELYSAGEPGANKPIYSGVS